MFKKSERGFTLIELLVVIAILGVLAGVAVPRVIGALNESRKGANEANLAIIQSAVERYYITYGAWPAAGTDIRALPTNIADFNAMFSSGAMPALQKATMPTAVDPAGTPAHVWGLNAANRVVVISTGTTPAQIWP